MNRSSLAFAMMLLVGVGCSSGGGGSGVGAGGEGGGSGMVGGDRPVEVVEPSSLAPGTKAPLLLLLHGYGVSGLVEEVYMGLRPVAEEKGFFYAFPTGTVDAKGSYWWNSTEKAGEVDDTAFLVGLIDEIVARYPVDPKRVYILGHSNGGFMAYRLACTHADKIAAIASLAGGMWLPPIACKPSEPVAVVQIHGTSDETVLYEGSMVGPVEGMPGYEGAQATVDAWAALDGCSSPPVMSPAALDLETTIAGAETTVQRYADGCKGGASVELWSIAGGGHIPQIGDSFRENVLSFLLAHSKP